MSTNRMSAAVLSGFMVFTLRVAQAFPVDDDLFKDETAAVITQVRRSSFYIPMRDSTRLAADLFMPQLAPGERVPTLFTQTRYWRRDDLSKQPRKELDLADQDQVADRRGVTDDDHSPNSSSSVRMSAPRSSSV